MAASFRLMTVNLLHEHCDASDFARVLADHDPDVVVTQELGPISADILASAYPDHRLRPALDFTGRGIATRLGARFGDIDMPLRPGTWASLDVAGARVWLAGVHLVNPIDFPWWTAVRMRGRQLEGLFDWMERLEGALVVAGDFNATPRWPAYRQVAARLNDVVADRARRDGLAAERTWAPRPGWPRMLRIDHVFGRGVVAQHAKVDTVRGTDHNPVVVDLELI